LLADSAQEQREGDTAAAKASAAAAAAILGTTQTTFDANNQELLNTRPQPNRFALFADSAAPQLLAAKRGSSKIGTAIYPILATINTPINPKGYFSNLGSVDWVGQYVSGLADSMKGVPNGAPGNTDADGNKIILPTISVLGAIPYFVGPDGVRNTADDLPYVTNNAAAKAEGYHLATPITSRTDQNKYDNVQPSGKVLIPLFKETAQITVPSAANPTIPKTVELYGVYNETFLVQQSCAKSTIDHLGLGGTFNSTTGKCLDSGGHDITQQALKAGCPILERRNSQTEINIGVNADGDCIDVNTWANNTPGGPSDKNNPNGQFVQYEILSLLSDPRARPAQAGAEPPDATDLRLYGNNEGYQIPARPRTQGNGLTFTSPGVANFYATHEAVVSNLDLHFNEDQLQWNHGASQHEHEFAEGYLEFEMADSQIFARVGKLIVIWGKTEFYRNQDRNNPLDIGNGLFSPLEESRVGQWAADVTFSPEAFMRVGPVEDLRLELLWIFDKFTPTDLGKCGEGSSVDLVCLKSFGAMASGLAAIGLAGEQRPNKDYNSWATWDYGARLEGRFDRFTFALSDFWGWDDGFYLNLLQQYERTADLASGAPLSVGSRVPGGHCKVRTNSDGVAVGPNGIPGDGDDTFASEGNCLLWGKPVADPNNPSAPAAQHLRAPEAIASLHNVNQTLFHSICAYTFDQEQGFCAFDRLNYPDTFGFVSSILGGLGGLGAIVIDGTETIRTTPNGYDNLTAQFGTEFKLSQFQAINPNAVNAQNPISQDLGVNLQPEQAALLGCGPAYASPCSKLQAAIWNADPAIHDSIARDKNLPLPEAGGVDLMNADASVVTQEFVVLKALEPGALVGTRDLPNGQLTYLPGINYSRNGSFVQVTNPNSGEIGAIETGQYLNLTPEQVLAMGRVGRAQYQNDPNDPKQADGWIEPMPWKVDQAAKKKWGAIVFEDDPNNPFDLKSPLNQFNLIDKNGPIQYNNIDGEYCARWMNSDPQNYATPFNHGCTVLESASANFERLLIATEIIGFDRVFDPPESLTELSNWGSGSTAKQATGDPIAGPDGIFARNAMVFNDQEQDFEVLTARQVQGGVITAPADKAAAKAFLTGYNPSSCPQSNCYLNVSPVLTDPTDVKSKFPLIIDMPISTPINVVAEPNDPNAGPPTFVRTTKVNLAGLELNDLKTLRKVLSGQVVKINGETLQLSQQQLRGPTGLFGPSTGDFKAVQDSNTDGVNDLDQNRDGIWDGMDDYTPGPITDDNILCGSGVRGDPLQEAAQYDPYRLDEAPGSAKFKAKFPNGLPPRSPVFCKSIAGLLAASTQTLPVKKAGGDGSFGRRDFLWQGGREVSTRYQKKNVFGFGLDFAEDTTKTSWGIEFSWMARKLFADSTTYSGLTQSDELVLSVSVDRPTFFNFLNPNRSFFLNFQMFVRYLPNYSGGTLYKNGMYGYAKGPFSGNMVFTFFTGYFQDRLAPRVSILYAPLESQAAIITGLSYRWNDAFSTSIGYSNFFGHVYDQQGAYFPIAQYSSVETEHSAVLGRGIAPVINRDQMEVRFRYTW
ncbi:MAG: hypothetical protein ACHQ6T_15100, partial [Myxococcota bacterium]